MPKGSTDYRDAIAAQPQKPAQTKSEWQEVTGKDFRKHFRQWDDHAKILSKMVKDISDSERKSEGLKAQITAKRSQIAEDTQAFTKPATSIDRLKDSENLYYIFSTNMQGRTLVGVKNGDEMGAAAAIIPHKHYIYIDFLMTNPKSLLDGKSKGAGTAVVKAVVKKSMDMGKGGAVKLWAVDSAIPFYEKIGFIRDSPNDNDMTLHPQAAKKLIGN